MNLSGLGVDIIEVKRFDAFENNRDDRFLSDNFSPEELDYCFSFKNPAPHLAGTFAAKEAVFKTLGQDNLALSSIEIKRNKKGQLTVWIKQNCDQSVLVSISHTAETAVAIAITL